MGCDAGAGVGVPLGGPQPGAASSRSAAGPVVRRAPSSPCSVRRGTVDGLTGEASWRWRMLLPSSDRSFDTSGGRRSVARLGTDRSRLDCRPVRRTAGDTLSRRIAVRNAAFVSQTDASVDCPGDLPRRPQRNAARRRQHGRRRRSGAEYVARFQPAARVSSGRSGEARQGTAAIGRHRPAMLVGGADLEMTDPRLNTQVLQRVRAGLGRPLVSATMMGRRSSPALRAGLPAARLAVTHDPLAQRLVFRCHRDAACRGVAAAAPVGAAMTVRALRRVPGAMAPVRCAIRDGRTAVRARRRRRRGRSRIRRTIRPVVLGPVEVAGPESEVRPDAGHGLSERREPASASTADNVRRAVGSITAR